MGRDVVFPGLGQEGLQLFQAAGVVGVGGHELGHPDALLVFSHHALPELQGLGRVVPRLGHEDEADVVRLGLLGPAVGEENAQLGAQAVALHDGRAGGRAHPAQGQPQPQAPGLGQRGLAQALPGMAGQGVGHFVRDHRGHAGFVLGILQDAGEDADLAPGQAEGVGLLTFEDQKLPAVIRALGRGR